MVGFAQELIDVHGAKLEQVAIQERRAANDYGLRGLLALDPPAHFHPREVGQVQIEQNQLEPALVRIQCDGFPPVGGFDDVKSLIAEELCDQVPKQVLILDQQKSAG
jgi:hypothetical protein